MAKLTPKKALLKLYRLIAQPRVIRQDRLVVVDEADTCARPIFLIGVHRSGTTLVRQIIDSHSHIACPPETYFLTYLAEAAAHKDFNVGLGNMGFDRAGAIQGLRRAANLYYETYRRSKGKPRWADKTPHYVMCVDFVEEMYGPGCQYLMIYRHPFDVVESLFRKGWDFMRYDPDPFLNVVKYVKDGLERMRTFAEQQKNRCHSVFYEKLLADPEGVLRAAFEFLDEPWEQHVLRFNEAKHDWGTGDPEAQVFKGFRPSLNNWHGWSDQQLAAARQHLGAVVQALDYTAARRESAT